MVRVNTKLTAAVENYLSDLARIRVSGGATGERPIYGPPTNLLNGVGPALKPKVFALAKLSVRVRGIPTSACMRRSRCGEANRQNAAWWR